MKLITPLLLLFAMVTANISVSQTVREQEIFANENGEMALLYNFVYDRFTGSYCYIDMDPVTFKYVITSRYGISKPYDFLSNYYIKFDALGNYYCVASNYYPAGTYDSTLYYLLINGEEVAQLEYAEAYDGFINPDDKFEFTIRDGEKFKIATVSSTSPIQFSQPFDEIRVAWRYIPLEDSSGEEDYFVRDSDRHRIYVVRNDGKAFLYHNGHLLSTLYSDIDNSSLNYDKNGQLTYIAKSLGRFWEDDGNEFVVQGSKSYNSYLKVYSPVLFTNANEPVYVVSTGKVGEDNYISNLAVGNEVKPAYTNASKTQKMEDFTAGIYNLNIDASDVISYVGSVRVNWDEFDYESVYSKAAFVVNDIGSEFFFDPGTVVKSMSGDELFSINPNQTYGKTVLNLHSNGENKIVSDDKFNFIGDYGFTPEGEIYYVGVISGSYDLGIKDQYIIVINGIETANYPSLIFSEVDEGKYSYLAFDRNNNYAYATYDLVDTASNFENWYSVSFLKTNTGTVTPRIIPFPGRAFFNSYERFMYLDNGVLFSIGNSVDYSNQYISYSQLNFGEKAADNVYSSIMDFKYDKLMNRMTFRASRDNKIYDVVVEP